MAPAQELAPEELLDLLSLLDARHWMNHERPLIATWAPTGGIVVWSVNPPQAGLASAEQEAIIELLKSL